MELQLIGTSSLVTMQVIVSIKILTKVSDFIRLLICEANVRFDGAGKDFESNKLA